MDRNTYRQLGNDIINLIRNNRSTLMVLSAIVVFVTTYLLILPALTLDTDQARQQGGIDVPVQQLEQEMDDFSVSASFDAKAGLPQDTELSVNVLGSDENDYDALYDEALQAVQTADGGESVKDLEFACFYDISLLSGGEPVEPDSAVDVTISYDKGLPANDADHLRIIHFGEKKTEVLDPDEAAFAIKKGKLRETAFAAESFSVYAVVYTVDFSYQVDGETYEYSLEGGKSIGLKKLLPLLGVVPKEEVEDFLSEIEDVRFSDEKLVEVERNDGGDWILNSRKPFDSEEALIVTMKNGEVFTIKVTDAQPTALEEIDGTKDYIIYYQNGNDYYALKTDGTTYILKNGDELKTLGSDCKWRVTYVYTDQTSGMPYYLIRPSGQNYKTLTLNKIDENLVQNGSNQTMLISYGDGFWIGGYNNVFLTNSSEGSFISTDTGIPSTLHFYDQSDVDHYQFAVRSSEIAMGKVEGKDITGANKSGAEFDSISGLNKKNQYSISAVPQSAKYQFNYWTLNGQRLDPNQYGATIPAAGLDIPANGTTLEAHFKIDPNYQVPDDDKEGRITNSEELNRWLKELKERTVPLDPNSCEKTAEVYDYENRIYRVDLTAKSSLTTFDGTVDLGLIMDASGSMQFPAKLEQVYQADGKTPLVYQLNQINASEANQNWLDKGKDYYIIADKAGTATVFRIFWQEKTETVWVQNSNGYGYHRETRTTKGWRAVDASYEESRSYEITTSTRFSNDSAGVNYPIYVEAEGETKGKKRMDYLQSSVTNTIKELNGILNTISVAKNGNEDPGVKVAWDTFYGELNDKHPTFESVKGTVTPSNWDTNGGTSTDLALQYAADEFQWENGSKRYAVLITDGAPQRSGKAIDSQTVKAAADALKNKGVTLITVGLSMGDVKRGSVLLYDIASTDPETNEPLFFKAEHGDELQSVMYEIIRKISQDATVIGDVTDTVSEGFYPVDVKTGSKLMPGDWVNLKGEKVDKGNYQGAHGILGNDGRTITWVDQDFTHTGWHGTIYVKAKEDLLGANGLATNTGNTKIEAKKYYVEDRNKAVELKEPDPNNSKYVVKKENIPTPLVNVNELKFTNNSSEWTVYLGEEVDPLEQLKKLYDEIDVRQVVSTDAISNETIKATATKDDYVYQLKESILDNRESEAETRTDNASFKLKDLIRKLTDRGDLDWDTLIRTGKLEIPYKVYNLDDNSKIVITLEPKVAAGEKDLSESPHDTTITGTGVEEYTLKAVFEPDYTRVPYGQNEQGMDEALFHTGHYGLYGYMGHAAGKETSENKHIINVYASPLDVIKIDNKGNTIAGAVFKLYKPDPAGEEIEGLTGKYVQVAAGTSDSKGTVHLITGTKDSHLIPGVEYMLVEASVPDGYLKDPDPKKVVLETQQDGEFTTLQGKALSSKIYPFNWKQAATLKVNDKSAEGSSRIAFRTKVENKINHVELDVTKQWLDSTGKAAGETGYTASFIVKRWYTKAGSKVEETVDLQADNLAVEEGQKDITLNNNTITLTCKDGKWPTAHLQKLLAYAENNAEMPYTYSVEETRFTSNGKIVKFDSTTYKREKGDPDQIDIVNKETSHIHININKKWKDGDGNEISGAAAPEESITFDVYRRTKVAHEHVWGDPVSYKDATCTEEGSYTHTCLKCGKEETVIIPAKGHVPGEWENDGEPYKENGLRYIHQVMKCTVCYKVLDERDVRYACEDDHHQFEPHETEPAGCTTTGKGHYVCSVCGEPQQDSEYVIPALGHDWNAGELDREPDCENGATRTYTCNRDASHTYEEEVPALGHDWEEHRTEPTCHEEGQITYTCKRDPNHSRESVTLPKLEHQWDDGEITKQPTATEKGTIVYTCLLCGDQRTEELDKLRETFVDNNGVDTGIVVEPFEWPIWKEGDPRGDFENDATGIIKCTLADGTVVYGVIFRKFKLNVEQLTQGPGAGGAANDTVRLTGKVFNSTTAPINQNSHTISGVNKGDLYQTPEGKWFVRLKDGIANNINSYNDLKYDDWYELPEAGSIASASAASTQSRALRAASAPKSALKMGSKKRGASNSNKNLSVDQRKDITAFLGITDDSFVSRAESDDLNGAGENKEVIEYVETVTINRTDDHSAWTWQSSDYDYADEDGNVYTYFAIEKEPGSGYEISYNFSGETNKLKDKETETIINQQLVQPNITIRIEKRDSKTNELLPEAEFKLTQVDDFGKDIKDGIVRGPQKTDATGALEFTELVPGKYRLEEVDPPKGYITTEGPYFINVTADGTDSVDDIKTLRYISVDEHTYTVKNEPGLELPNSGGPGTTWIYLLGSILILCCGTLLIARRRIIG